MRRTPFLALLAALCAGCARAPEAGIDAALLTEIRKIQAIDNHAHPVRVTAAGEAPDRGFDALPVDNMEAQSDPLSFRPQAPGMVAAANALFAAAGAKARIQGEQREKYPSWVLDQSGIEVMLANRVTMGTSLPDARFRWVPYADALIFPLDNSGLAVNPDRKAFFALEDQLRDRYWKEAGVEKAPATLGEYLAKIVTPTLERHRKGGAVAEKFEAAYLRSLAFDRVERAEAERVYSRLVGKTGAAPADYKPLQDFLFRYVAAECGRLGMAVHIHTMAGAGGYFDVGGANPLHLESVFNDPGLRKTKFVMVHGGWPFTREIGALLTKPNAYLDISGQVLAQAPAVLAGTLREWLGYVPEKVLFGTDAYPYSAEAGWEESCWMGTKTGREALAMALTGMVRDGEIPRSRALELARMVLRDNAKALYGF